MWDFINVLYREYCLARLVEMRQLELKNWQSRPWEAKSGSWRQFWRHWQLLRWSGER